MKKLIALLLALMLTFSMVGCSGGGPELLGKYETTLDLTDFIVEEFDSGTGMGDVLTLGDFLSDFSLTIQFEFKEDGTYVQGVDMASFDAAMENMAAALPPLLDEMLLIAFKDTFASIDQTATSREDFEALLGMSWDDIFADAFGTDISEYVDELMGEMSVETLGKDLVFEGKYKAEDGKLHITYSMDEEINENAYETYEISGNVVTITGGVNIEEEDLMPYPYTMTKVG